MSTGYENQELEGVVQKFDEDLPSSISSLPARVDSSARAPSNLKYGYAYGGPHSQREKPLREYISTLVYYRFLIALTTVVGIYVGHVLHRRQPIYYQTTAVVNIGSYLAPTDGPTADVIKFETSRMEYMENLTPMLSSYALAREALRKDPVLRAAFDPDFVARGENINPTHSDEIPVYALDGYLGSLNSGRDKSTTLFNVTATSGNAELATRIANAHAEAFSDAVRKQRFTWAMTNVEFLSKRAEDLRKKTASAEAAMTNFAREKNISLGSSTRQSELNSNRIEGMVSAIGETALDKVLTEQQYRALRGSVSSDGISVSDKSFTFLPQLRSLEAQVAKMRASGYSLAAMEQYETQIRDLKNLLKQSTQQELRDAKAKRNAAEAKEKFLKAELDELKKTQKNKAEDEVHFLGLEKDAKSFREELTKLESRLEEAQINAESDQRSVSVVDPAVTPLTPISGHRVSNLLSGALLGLLIGIGCAFFLDHQRGAVRTTSDLQAIIDAPVLGIIPTFSNTLAKRLRPLVTELEEEEIEHYLHSSLHGFSSSFQRLFDERRVRDGDQSFLSSSRLILIAQPHGRESESLRNIRAALKFSNRSVNPRRIVITSGQKHDGKSTVTVNLAASIAQTLSRTLLIDADLRMPTVHTFFNHDRNQRGLGDFLSRPGRLSEHVLSTELEYLDVMVAGTPVHNPAELLGTRAMLELLEQASEEYDYVFIDTPPIGEIADALLLCPACDGVVIVARSNTTPAAVLQLADTRLSQVRARILGCVLNGVSALDGAAEGYYGYSYSYAKTKK